jgi:integrase
MTRISIKGFQIFTDLHGRPRCYHRATRIAVDLTKAPIGSAEFFAECARIAALAMPREKPKPGALGMLIAAYRSHEAFLNLASRTQQDYQRVFDYLKPIEDTSLSQFTRPLVVRIRDKAMNRGRRFANYVKAVLSILFSWGLERGYVQSNPARNVKSVRRPRDAPLANRPWRDEERHVVLDRAPAHLRPAIALMMFTGLGPKDALRLPRPFYRDGEIAARRAKTGEPVFWPVPEQLRQVLASAPEHNALTLCANSNGQPWTGDGFRASWRSIRLRLEQTGDIDKGLTMYGLRHTAAVILREAGFDERTIADALGQKTIEMARHYARGADLMPKMRKVVASFDAELNKRRTKVVKPTGK